MSVVHAAASTLAESYPGHFRCDEVHAVGQNAIRLKRLGVCAGRSIELIGLGDPMVVRIGESRVGLSRQLAALVTVQVSDENPVAPSNC